MKKKAKGVRGCICWTPLDNKPFFRVYGEGHKFVDYQIDHCDCFVIIDDESAFLYNDDVEGEGRLDYDFWEEASKFIQDVPPKASPGLTDARVVLMNELERIFWKDWWTREEAKWRLYNSQDNDNAVLQAFDEELDIMVQVGVVVKVGDRFCLKNQ